MRSGLFSLVRLASVLGVVLAGGAAHARAVHFIGGHPITAKQGGGYCYIDAPHLHAYTPDRPQLYQRVGDEYVFAADPTPFGYDGPKHPFYGNHPVVTVGTEPVFCYIDGPHYHPFEAPDVDYKTEKGVAFYVGAYPPSYARLKPQRRKVVNVEYRPFVAQRPVVEVTPPPMWQGEVWVAPPAVEVRAPGVAVSAPGVVVAPPSVAVSAPGVVVQPPGVVVSRPGVVVAAPHVAVTAPGVYVGGPSVHVSRPGVVVSAPAAHVGGTVYVEGGRGHHDNGRHNGWRHKRHD
jgi:hypothetical protein